MLIIADVSDAVGAANGRSKKRVSGINIPRGVAASKEINVKFQL
jgi:hypothetical protein